MDTSSTLIGAAVGVVAKSLEELLRHYLRARHQAKTHASQALTTVVREAYWPSIQVVDRLTEQFPRADRERRELVKILRDKGFLFDQRDREAISVAISRYSNLDDLLIVRNQLSQKLAQLKAAGTLSKTDGVSEPENDARGPE